jgi:hypothetical protein
MARKHNSTAKPMNFSAKSLGFYSRTLRKITTYSPLDDWFVYRAVCIDEKDHLTDWVSRAEMEEARSAHLLSEPTHITDYKKKRK